MAVDNQIYHISYPSGCFTNNEGTDFVGTAYTFQSRYSNYNLWVSGSASYGQLGQNNRQRVSSPVQIPGNKWSSTVQSSNSITLQMGTSDGEKWVTGNNAYGRCAQNNAASPGDAGYSSPVQIPGTTWSGACTDSGSAMAAVKTDGTLWTWGFNDNGKLGHNENQNDNPGAAYSSPVQVGSDTTWGTTYGKIAGNQAVLGAIKTDGTLWVWGDNSYGTNGHNNRTVYSSPTQIPGTSWSTVAGDRYNMSAIRTDGTLWIWGMNNQGELGQNSSNPYPSGSEPGYARGASSPVQVPGTTWAQVINLYEGTVARKTDGTLWAWGNNGFGQLGQNQGPGQIGNASSPIQITGTTWNHVVSGYTYWMATKTDGTLWACGYAADGHWGRNIGGDNRLSSPTQIHSDVDWSKVGTSPFRLGSVQGIKYITESDA